eukprot:g56454.t1
MKNAKRPVLWANRDLPKRSFDIKFNHPSALASRVTTSGGVSAINRVTNTRPRRECTKQRRRTAVETALTPSGGVYDDTQV